MAKLIDVAVNKKNSVDYSPAVTRWVNPDFITEMEVGDSNGAIFRYHPPYAASPSEYHTDTAASDIETAANA